MKFKNLNEGFETVDVCIVEPDFCYDDCCVSMQSARLFIIAYCCQKTNKLLDVLNDFARAMTCPIDELIKMCGANGKAFAVTLNRKFEGGNRKILSAYENFCSKDRGDRAVVGTPDVQFPELYINADGRFEILSGKISFEVDFLAW